MTGLLLHKAFENDDQVLSVTHDETEDAVQMVPTQQIDTSGQFKTQQVQKDNSPAQVSAEPKGRKSQHNIFKQIFVNDININNEKRAKSRQ